MIEAAKLSKGQYLSDQDIAALIESDEGERAYEGALHFLSYRPRSQAEVRRRLHQKDFSDTTIDAVIDRLTRARLIDDRAFAEYWIRNREQFRPRGRYGLRHELRQKGVDSSIIDALLDTLDEEASAYRVAVQRVESWQRAKSASQLDLATLRRKLNALLRRRGFGYAAIQDTWDRIQAERLADHGHIEREDETTWDQQP